MNLQAGFRVERSKSKAAQSEESTWRLHSFTGETPDPSPNLRFRV